MTAKRRSVGLASIAPLSARPICSTMPRASFFCSRVAFDVADISMSWNLTVELPQLKIKIFTSASAVENSIKVLPRPSMVVWRKR